MNTNKIVNFDVINSNWYVHIKEIISVSFRVKFIELKKVVNYRHTNSTLVVHGTKKSLFKNARSRLSSMSKNDNALPERRKMYSSHNQTRNETRRPNNYDYGIPPSYDYPQYGYPPDDVSQYMYPPYDVPQYGYPPYDVPQYGNPPSNNWNSSRW